MPEDRWGMALVRKEASVTLLTHAAQNGFLNLTVPLLKRLWKDSAFPREAESMPATERPLVETMVRACLPSVTDAEVNAILQKRFGKPEPMIETVLEDKDNAELVADAFEASQQ